MDTWKLMERLGNIFSVGFSLSVFSAIVYSFSSVFSLGLIGIFLIEIIFMVAVAVFSYRKIKSLKDGVLFGFGAALVSALFFVVFPVISFAFFVYSEFAGLDFVILAFRFVGFSIGGFFGSYVWVSRQPYDA